MVDWVPLNTSVEGCRPALASFISRAAKRFWLGKSTYSHFTSTPYIFFIAATTSFLARTSSMMAWAMSVPPSGLGRLDQRVERGGLIGSRSRSRAGCGGEAKQRRNEQRFPESLA